VTIYHGRVLRRHGGGGRQRSHRTAPVQKEAFCWRNYFNHGVGLDIHYSLLELSTVAIGLGDTIPLQYIVDEEIDEAVAHVPYQTSKS
jgi:hypothetical protein